jgi:hypothetical protein
VLNKRHSFTAKHDSRFLWFCDQGGYPKALSISGALGIKWWSSQDKRIKSNMRCKKLWVSLSKHIHTMWPFRSLHGMLWGLWQLPYLHNPDHQYCARQASTLRTINGSRTHLGGTWFSIKKSQCSPPIPSFDVALDNNLISLKSHCILLWTFYEG